MTPDQMDIFRRSLDIPYDAEWSPYDHLGINEGDACLLYTSPSPRDRTRSRMPSSA